MELGHSNCVMKSQFGDRLHRFSEISARSSEIVSLVKKIIMPVLIEFSK
jgi:hypothetical protein